MFHSKLRPMNLRCFKLKRPVGAPRGWRAALAGLALVCATGFVAEAQPLASAARTLPASAQITFQGTSTLHDFEGGVAAQPFVLTLSSNTWSAKAAVVSSQMSTAHEARDNKMWDMLSAKVYRQISGEVRPAPIPSAASTNVTLSLRIRDRQHDLPVRITGWTETAEAIQFHAAWDVSLKQYGLKPPSVVGLIRVGDRVHLEAQVTARKVPAATAAAPAATNSNP